MKLRRIDAAELAARDHRTLGARPGDPAYLAELTRAELAAEGTTVRRVLTDRIERVVAHGDDQVRDRILDTLRDLESIGDFVRASHGSVAPAPLRVVTLGPGTYALAAGLASRALGQVLGVELAPTAGLRRVTVEPEAQGAFAAAVSAFGGQTISVEQWSGCDREPEADEAWLARLAASATAVSSETWTEAYRPSPSVKEQARRWVRESQPEGLVRRWNPGGWWSYGWITTKRTCASLTRDEALRTTFALSRHARCPIELQARLEEEVAVFVVPLLPRAEYRLILASCSITRTQGSPSIARVPLSAWPSLRTLLASRLGVVEAGSGDRT